LELYSEIALSRKPFGIGHMYIYKFLLRATDTMTSQNTDLPSWDTLYNDTLSISVYDVGRWFHLKIMNWSEFGRKRSWRNLRYYRGIFLGDWGKSQDNLSYHTKYHGLDMYLIHPEYWREALPLDPICLIIFRQIISESNSYIEIIAKW
jgi:hypothetical protein